MTQLILVEIKLLLGEDLSGFELLNAGTAQDTGYKDTPPQSTRTALDDRER